MEIRGHSVPDDRRVRGTSEMSPPDVSPNWYMLLIMLLVATIGTLDRTLVPALAEPIKREFALSDASLGLLTGLAFSLSYTVVGVPLGLLLDRVNRVRMLSGLVGLWSVITMTCGAATGSVWLLLARIGVAGAESGCNPTCISLINDSFPPERRATALGIFYWQAAGGTSLAFVLAGFMSAHYGWRSAFVAAGLVGVVLVVVMMLTLREPQRVGVSHSGAEMPRGFAAFREVIRTLVGDRVLLPLLVGSVVFVGAMSSTTAFTSSFFIRRHGLDLAQAGLAAGVIHGVGLTIGTLGGGLMTDFAVRRGDVASPCRLTALCCMAIFALAIPAYILTSLKASMVLLLIMTALSGTFFSPVLSTVLRIAPAPRRGSVLAIFMLFLNLGGYGLGPPVAGAISDLLRGYQVERPLEWALVIVSSFFLVPAIAYYICGRRMAAPQRTMLSLDDGMD